MLHRRTRPLFGMTTYQPSALLLSGLSSIILQNIRRACIINCVRYPWIAPATRPAGLVTLINLRDAAPTEEPAAGDDIPVLPGCRRGGLAVAGSTTGSGFTRTVIHGIPTHPEAPIARWHKLLSAALELSYGNCRLNAFWSCQYPPFGVPVSKGSMLGASRCRSGGN